jgi:polyribonucleotide nucleotidyltransferase
VQIAEIDDRGKLSLIPVVEEGSSDVEPADDETE